jgi:hypothetical protein
MKAKYVIVATGPILFPESIQHSVFRDLKPSSAGFVIIDKDNHASTYGESQSLKLKPKPGDGILIEVFFELKGT